MKMKFSLFFLLALQLSPKIPSAIGLKCYDCESDDNPKFREALASKEGTLRENQTFVEHRSCEGMELASNIFLYLADEKKDGVNCPADNVCTGHFYDIKLEGKSYRYSLFQCASPSELKKQGFHLKIGYCVEVELSKNQSDFKALGAKISNNRICACDTDRCYPLTLPYNRGARQPTMASWLALVSNLGVIFNTIKGVRSFGFALLVYTLFNLI